MQRKQILQKPYRTAARMQRKQILQKPYRTAARMQRKQILAKQAIRLAFVQGTIIHHIRRSSKRYE